VCASFGLDKSRGRPVYVRGVDVFPSELDGWAEPIRPTGPKALNLSPISTPASPRLAWWGLWVGTTPGKFSTINATVERLTSGLWAQPFARRRCLVPATHYYEFRDEGGARKQRYAFRLPDGSPFFFAGVAAPAYHAAADLSYALVTRPPTDRAAQIHNRMPMLLPESFLATWLDPDRPGTDDLRADALAASQEIVEQIVYEPA